MAKSKKNPTSNPNIVDTQRQGITSVADPNLSSAAGNAQGRMTTGPGGPGFSAREVVNGTAVTKEGYSKNDAGDPSMNTEVNRPHEPQERLGAAYRIQASSGYATPNAPEAALTQANGRILPPALDRSRTYGGFQSGMQQAAQYSPPARPVATPNPPMR